MTNWTLTHCVGSVRKVSFKFPENFILKSRQSVKLWAGNRNSSNNINLLSNRFNRPSFSCSSSLSSSSSSLSCKSLITNGANTNNASNGISNTNGFYLNSKDNYVNNSPNGGAAVISNGVATGGVNGGGGELLSYSDNIENELILYDIENWTCGSQEMFIRLENEFGEEKCLFRKTN